MNKAILWTVLLGLSFYLFAGHAQETEMLGPLQRPEILQNNPDWQAVVASYEPKPEAVERLRSYGREVRIEIFLGTWCPDSKAHVSECFKVLDLADNPLLQASYIGIPRDKDKRKPYYGGKDIERLPTFVVFVEGREAGRIVEIPKRSFEEDLLGILEK